LILLERRVLLDVVANSKRLMIHVAAELSRRKLLLRQLGHWTRSQRLAVPLQRTHPATTKAQIMTGI